MDVTIVGTQRSLVACTNKCGRAIICLDQSIIITIHLSQFATEFQSAIFLSREVGLRNKDEV